MRGILILHYVQDDLLRKSERNKTKNRIVFCLYIFTVFLARGILGILKETNFLDLFSINSIVLSKVILKRSPLRIKRSEGSI